MGFIYKITVPSGKIYIGQTIKPLDTRWKQHITEAISNSKHMHIHDEIRDNIDNLNIFQMDIIEIVDDEFLDEKEAYYIREFNSLYPNGLNIRQGMNLGKLYGYDLPDYVRLVLNEVDKTTPIGFRVDLPGKKAYKFTHPDLTMEEKHKLVMEQYDLVKAGRDNPDENRKKHTQESADLPMYVTWVNEGAKSAHAEVRIPRKIMDPNHTGLIYRKFSSKHLNREQLIDKAIEFRNGVLNGTIKEKVKPAPSGLPKYITWREDQQKVTFRDPRTNKTYNFMGKGRSKEQLINTAIEKKREVLGEEDEQKQDSVEETTNLFAKLET